MKVIINFSIAMVLVFLFAAWDFSNLPIEDSLSLPVVPVEASEPQEVSYTPVETYVRLKFGVDGQRAITLLRGCENKEMNTTAINWNRNGTWDFGLFQVNQIHGYTQEQLADYKFNTDVAYKIYQRAGNSFTPWTCASEVGDVPFYLK